MKRIFKTIVVAAAALLPLAAAAQKNIANAIKVFGAGEGKYGVWSQSNEKSPKGAYSTVYQFRLPKKEEKKLDFLEKAFYQDASEAYDVFVKKANDTSKSNKLIVYGASLEKSMSLGWPTYKSGRNYLFMFFASKEKPDYRYVYGLEWHEKGKNVEGTVVEIFSLDPKKVKRDKSFLTYGGIADYQSALKDLDSAAVELNDLKQLKTLAEMSKKLRGKGLNGYIFDNGGKKTELLTDKQSVIVRGDGSILIDDGEGNTMELDEDGNVTGIGKSAKNTDPIQQFGNLRVAYLKNLRMVKGDGASTVLTGLANSILDLCKKKGAQMSLAEKQLCAEGLKEMQQVTSDKFVKGIFGVAISVLNKYGELDKHSKGPVDQ